MMTPIHFLSDAVSMDVFTNFTPFDCAVTAGNKSASITGQTEPGMRAKPGMNPGKRIVTHLKKA